MRQGAAFLLGLGVAAAVALWASAQEAPTPPRGGADAEGSRARIRLPAGDCPTGRLELQIYDREGGRWVPHPAHPRVAAGACVEVQADRLLSELRVRCVDPQGRRPPSEWVQGVRLDAPLGPEACGPPPAPGR